MIPPGIKRIDIAIHLWVNGNCRPQILYNLTGNSQLNIIHIIRKALGYYWRVMVKPYLIFDDQIEMDETACKGQGDYNHLVATKMHRWIFGMMCRRTRLVLMYAMIHR
jgi:hypothetical protein